MHATATAAAAACVIFAFSCSGLTTTPCLRNSWTTTPCRGHLHPRGVSTCPTMSATVELTLVEISNPNEAGVIIGQAHFIKTVEDLSEALASSTPDIKYGVAFCEASAKRLVRSQGNDEELVALAKKNAVTLSAGHSFVIHLSGCFPLHVLSAVKAVPEVAGVFCATNNPLDVLVASTSKGRGIVGVVDGMTPLGVEGDEECGERKSFLRTIGLKF